MNAPRFDQNKKKEFMLRTGFSMGVTVVVTFTLAFSILFIIGQSTLSALGNSFVFSVLMMINTLVLSLICNNNSNYLDDYSKLFKSTQSILRVSTIFVMSILIGYYSMNALKNGLINEEDTYEVDEFSMLFSVVGIFFGISNSFIYVFLDTLYIQYFVKQINEGDIQYISFVVGKQTFISFILNFIIFIFSVVVVKVYVFFLAGFGLDLEVYTLPFDTVDLIRYMMIILLFSFSSRFSFKFLSYRMSLQ
ncbi:hypothetical protein EDI_109000 [Entamoeba dispar SAW760]|uniref:Uncharacterized protein n=1 Tax=Entamoeba dispar (strain ATCC PRA-260 / SAW760) TaxID=370354 RepID=B0EJS6_ENTDS|nr:uncharacterized protein EDI_109000 [Entamoeba dispar SAW760]EDR25221.1 hypothetical protein EDI_109000 [Entamoeba dispar SAW760]|eukprot:EDR25221.1 hypothetical protein EDI_109000 [Entamoeba dispar SAW760]